MSFHTGSVDERVAAILRESDRRAERIVSFVRMGIAGVLLVTLALGHGFAMGAGIEDRVRDAEITLALLFAAGLVVWLILRAGLWRPWIAYVTVAVDVLLVAFNVVLDLWATHLPGEFAPIFPIGGGLTLILAASALRFRPNVQIFTTVMLIGAATAVGLIVGRHAMPDPGAVTEAVVALHGMEPNAARMLMVALAGAILTLGAVRGRRLLRRAVSEAQQRHALGRFLPSELTPLIATRRLEDLMAGRRAAVVLLFVDIRGSTDLEETLEPVAIVDLIGAFRRRVTRAAQGHGAIIEKFVGDGAFLVFGLPQPKADDAQRALACGEALLAAVEDWNAERALRGEVPVRIGVGIHAGEAFVGALGDEARLEFTVLGDAVNVASRIEQATKHYRVPLLASGDTLALAGRDGWACVDASAQLPGRSRPVALYAPPSPVAASLAS